MQARMRQSRAVIARHSIANGGMRANRPCSAIVGPNQLERGRREAVAASRAQNSSIESRDVPAQHYLDFGTNHPSRTQLGKERTQYPWAEVMQANNISGEANVR
jgi:hypothetical protein